MQAHRVLAAIGLIPVVWVGAYWLSLAISGSGDVIENNGSALGLMIVLIGSAAVAKLAEPRGWRDRFIMTTVAGATYFAVVWTFRSDDVLFKDESPEIVFLAFSLAVFAPLSVLMVIAGSVWEKVWVSRRTEAAIE